ncbi:hypothetical protein ABT083_36620 [Streptomyces goshikiensis]|uniref:hypothetical protein n=1 Tax=Streptomyces goshikiensis TaxID=1942 RepID=UPI00332B5928
MEGGSVQGLDLEQQRLLDTVAALEEDVAWHSPARFIVVANIARERLTGPWAEENERMLYEEREDFDDLYHDILHAREETRQKLLQGTTDYDWSGRGGTAVWRAERQVALQHVEDWLVDPTGTAPAQMLTAPPGWMLLRPTAWTAAAPALTRDGQLPQPFPQWLREGRVLTFPYRNRQALWPVQRIQRAPGWEPIPGIEALLAPARALPAEKVIGYIETLLIEWNHQFDPEEGPAFHSILEIPAGRAHDIGLIAAEEGRAAMAEARERTCTAWTRSSPASRTTASTPRPSSTCEQPGEASASSNARPSGSTHASDPGSRSRGHCGDGRDAQPRPNSAPAPPATSCNGWPPPRARGAH